MNDEKNKPLLVPLSDVQEKTAEWLVPGYMPRQDAEKFIID